MKINWEVNAGTRVLLCLLATLVLTLAGAAIALGWLPVSVLDWLIPAWAGILSAYITFRGVEKRGKDDS